MHIETLERLRRREKYQKRHELVQMDLDVRENLSSGFANNKGTYQPAATFTIEYTKSKGPDETLRMHRLV